MIVAWKAWYVGNRTFSSYAHDWAMLPKEGVLVVIVFLDKFASNGQRVRELLSGRRRYFMATGSSGNLFMKGSLWSEKRLLRTYATKPEWIKEGIWDDDETIDRVTQEALKATIDG